MTLAEIEILTRKYADAHGALSACVGALNAEIENLKRARLPELKRLVGLAAQRKAVLSDAISYEPGLFEKPRTHVFHGVKVGLAKERGGIEFEDAASVVKRTKAMFGAEAAAYLHIEERPDKVALGKLTVAELKKLGCEVRADSDAVVIKPTDSAVEKIVAALLKDAEPEA